MIYLKHKEPFYIEDDGLNVSAANDVEVAEPQPEVETEVQTEVETEVETPTEAPPDITQTQQFAHRLKEEKQKAIDVEYDRLYGADYGIHSKAEYDNYMERQRLLEEGKDPELYQLKSEVESFKFDKKIMSQHEALSKDPVNGDVYKEWEPELRERLKLYDEMYQNKQIAQRVDMDTAFTLMWKEKGPSIISELKQKLDIQNSNKDNAERSIGSVTGKGTVPSGYFTREQVKAMSDKEVYANLEAIEASKKNW